MDCYISHNLTGAFSTNHIGGFTVQHVDSLHVTVLNYWSHSDVDPNTLYLDPDLIGTVFDPILFRIPAVSHIYIINVKLSKKIASEESVELEWLIFVI